MDSGLVNDVSILKRKPDRKYKWKYLVKYILPKIFLEKKKFFQ